MLRRDDWTDEKNLETFGKCSNPNWHGHNYVLFITIKGEPSDETGFVANLSEVSKIVKSQVLDLVDHKNLNLDVPFLSGKITSTENLAIGIWKQIKSEIEKLDCKLHCVKLQETENNSVEYYG